MRSPTASQGQGGALGEAEARKRGNTVGIRDQAMDLAKLQGHKVSREAANLAERQLSVPTPTASDAVFGGLIRKVTQVSPNRGVGLPLWANRIVTDFYLPTPKALDGVKGNLKTSQERIDSGRQVDLPNVAIDLLGTPRANAANSSSKQVEAGAPKSRIEDQVKLFNTPTTMDAKATNNPEIAQKFLDQGRQTCLTYDVATNWGKFEPAIRRWEAIIGRPAPEPTKPDGKDGNHRLSSKFTEWMMGLPDGWITGHDLKRNDELKLAGNGVVPQQAELALRLLLELPEERKR